MIKALCIIGAGVIAGTVVYAFLDKNRKESASANISKKETTSKGNQDIKNKVVNNIKETHDNKTEESDIFIVNNNHAKYDEEFNNRKMSSINKIAQRHQEAASVMKDAVDIINKRSEVSEDENHELEQISDELDELLREE